VRLLRPKALPAEPLVAVVAPSGDAKPERVDAGAAALSSRGWRMRFLPHARGRHAPYFSGTPQQRVADLHTAFLDPQVDAILCVRGGYGANYLLPLLDLDLIAAHPKPLLGYSDVTAIQTWLLDQTGLVTLHAPMLAVDFRKPEGVDEPSLRAILAGQTHTYGPAEGLRLLRPGRDGDAATGMLYGGCLSMLASSLGTPYAPQTEGKLLFLEDIAEAPYRLDRMLRQLVLAGKLEGVSGIIFGEMQDCEPAGSSGAVDQAILHALSDFPGPIATGLRSGHVSRGNLTLPLGVAATLHLTDACPTLVLHQAALRAPGYEPGEEPGYEPGYEPGEEADTNPDDMRS
jgi:muramoyltetrapeptide carboxypeptidase